MIFVLIGIILAVICFVLLDIFTNFKEETMFFICAIIVLVGLICSLSIDLGYEEKELVCEIELTSLDTSVSSTGIGRLYYVSVSAEKVYTYRYEKENDTGIPGRLYESDTVYGNVEELESIECTTPVLKVYKEKAKGKFWLAILAKDRESYLFYVPEGTIGKDIVLE